MKRTSNHWRWLLGLVMSIFATFNTYATDNYAHTQHPSGYPEYPKVNYGSGAPAELIKRGEYLVKLGDCIACHTTDGGKPFAGGRAIKTPFGSIYTPNITGDKSTGIGNWSEKDFAKAMREGISPQGKYYYPAFPYLYFNQITDEDLKAIKAYLSAIPAIQQANKSNDMMFPFNWRFLQLGWRLLFFHVDGPFKNNPKQSAQWNRGYYIVQGLGHCAMCHTPSHHLLLKKWSLAAPIRKYDLTGGFVDGFYAPNITHSNLAHATVKDLRNVFLKDQLIGGGHVQGPMLEANHDSLKYLRPEDITAITIYLKSVTSQVPPKPKVSGGPGADVYQNHCAVCHNVGAGGAPKFADKTAWTPLAKQGLNILYRNAINGIRGMPAKGGCLGCTNQQVQQAVQYMVDAAMKGDANSTASNAPSEAPPKPLTMAQGKAIYEKHCSACHNPDSTAIAPKIGDKNAWQPLIKQGFDILVMQTIRGKNGTHVRGNCKTCNDAEVKAAVKYMVQQSRSKGDYSLW